MKLRFFGCDSLLRMRTDRADDDAADGELVRGYPVGTIIETA